MMHTFHDKEREQIGIGFDKKCQLISQLESG